jgi:sugar lactone lactonase YvrE
MRAVKRLKFVVPITLACVVALAAPQAGAGPRPYGDARVLARFPNPPGFPEGIAVRDGRVYVAGPATFGTTGKPPSAVVAYDRETGATVRRYDTKGENRLMEHANSSIAFDGAGRLYVLNSQLGMYRLDTATGAQQAYSKPFPNLHPCIPILIGPPCSPTLTDLPPVPNDLAFDAAGNAYVTDSTQATIWKVRPGGGKPQVWFQHRRLASPYIGTNGIRIHPSGSHVYFTVTTDLLARAFVYRLPLVAKPKPAQLKVFHEYVGALPDGIAFGDSGQLYVAIATPLLSGVSILSPAGNEVRRLRNPLLSPIAPYDSPANIAFDGAGAILLSNHAFVTGLVLERQFAVLDVFVDDNGAPLFEPPLP